MSPSHVGWRYQVVELDAGGVSLHQREWHPPEDEHPWVLLRPTLVGVCGSDLREVHGRRLGLRTFGHELVAVLTSSEGVAGLRPGRLVTVDPHVTLRRTSGFGELMVLRGAAGDLSRAVIELPTAVEAARLVFVEPLACVCHTVGRIATRGRTAALTAEPTALVIGAGTYGTLLAIVLAGHFAVTLVNPAHDRLDFLRENPAVRGVRVQVMEDSPEPGYDLVVLTSRECTEELVRYATVRLRDGGVFVPFGATHHGQRFGGVDLHYLRQREGTADVIVADHRITVLGCHGATRHDFEAAIEMVTDPEFPAIEQLISARTTLDGLLRVLSPRGSGQRQPGKVVVDL